MRRVIVQLDRHAVDALRRLALAERRQPSEQARYLLERSLAASAQTTPAQRTGEEVPR
jgi:hypothetical protein